MRLRSGACTVGLNAHKVVTISQFPAKLEKKNRQKIRQIVGRTFTTFFLSKNSQFSNFLIFVKKKISSN